MSEYTFETAALKAVTIDAVKYNEEGLQNSLTPSAIQAVAPISWGGDGVNPFAATTKGGNNIAIGTTSHSQYNGTSVGARAYSDYCSVALGTAARAVSNAIAIGYDAEGANNSYGGNIAIGSGAKAKFGYCISIGGGTISSKQQVVTIGSKFTETTDSGNVTHTCTTEGTGSITIGAGANTLNNGDTESSNSVTIGCKAENKGADSVVIGAQASGGGADVIIGAGAKMQYGSRGVAIGREAKIYSNGVAVGCNAQAKANNSLALGYSCAAAGMQSVAIGNGTNAKAARTNAIGTFATVYDYGATVIRSTAEDGTYTQLYFSGANTPLANKYFPTAWEQKQDVDPETNEPLFDENGDPVMVDDKDKPIAGDAMMGFVATDKDGNIIARGANMLSALFPYYTGAEDDPFAPTTMSLDGEKPEPVAFHPSDLDMPQEEPITPEMEEYTPLPVYPIVEPEIEEIDE